ncbi:LCP family protein [Indiicoccus explosivorum]|uniref:LCP family glycopolymer transferase n=1 Tax=Indiicoccus explosivorum TaxID=1917864 RepID=UPI000B451B32|nr:LCP family protein [Indiicoccus explosivorum]
MKRSERKASKRKKWPWFVGILAVLAIGAGAYIWSVYSSFSNTIEDIHSPIDREVSDMRMEEVELKDKDPFSVLLLGVDERENDSGRSDTMIVATVNPEDGSMKMVSIPRDTYTEIVGYGMKDKINHAYAFGGIEMSMETVENLLDIPIDYVVEVNMEGFKEIVDAVGGVTVSNSVAFDEFPEGEVHLSGSEALGYVRMRKEDPRGDFGRQDRQKQVIQGVMREGASVSSLMNYRGIFNALGDNVKTNMSFDEMMEVQKNYRNAVETIDQLSFDQGIGETINGVWYYMMNERELKEVQDVLKGHLELE